MKKFLVSVLLIFIVISGFNGCFFLKTEELQPGKEVIKKPNSSKPPIENKCYFTVKQKYDVHKEIIELIVGNEQTYEFRVKNENKTGTLNFKITPSANIISINPTSLSVASGSEGYVKIIFKMPDMPTRVLVPFTFTVTPDCNAAPQVVTFKVKALIPYTLELLSTPVNQLQRGKSIVYSYQIYNNSIDPDQEAYIEFYCTTGNVTTPKRFVVNPSNSAKFDVTLTMPSYAKINTTIAFDFKIRFGYFIYFKENYVVGCVPDHLESFEIVAK